MLVVRFFSFVGHKDVDEMLGDAFQVEQIGVRAVRKILRMLSVTCCGNPRARRLREPFHPCRNEDVLDNIISVLASTGMLLVVT